MKKWAQLDKNTHQTKPLKLPPKKWFFRWALTLKRPEDNFLCWFVDVNVFYYNQCEERIKTENMALKMKKT